MGNSKQLLILGNGFDKHCGLASGYGDFFKNAILEPSTAKSTQPKLQSDCDGFWERLLFEYHKKNGNQSDYNWCKVEEIIKRTLFEIRFNEKTVQKNHLGFGIWWAALNCMKAVNDPIEKSKTINDPIEKYLFLYCARFFYNIIKSNNQKSDFEMLEMLFKNLFQELHNFEKRFCNYLRRIIFPEGGLNEEYVIKAINTLLYLGCGSSNAFERVDDIVHQEEIHRLISPKSTRIITRTVNILSDKLNDLSTTNILSFNYTNVFDILETESPCLFSNVHGKLCVGECANNCGISNIIFGIDDTSLSEKENTYGLRLFSKTYRKMFDTHDMLSVLPDKDKDLITIKFFGHSLDEADYSYFQSIFDYYDLYGNSNVGLAFCYSSGFENTDNVYSLINAYGKTLDNIAQGRNLIHKLLLENRLKIFAIP